MKKWFLAFVLMVVNILLAISAYAADVQIIAPSSENLFAVEYSDESMVSGGRYSLTVLKSGTDITDYTRTDVLYIRQGKADENKTVSFSNIALMNDALEGDVYLGGAGLSSVMKIAILADHDCADYAVHYEAQDATCTLDGNIEYWYCAECPRYYSSIDTKTVITQADTVVEAGHKTEKINAADETCTDNGNTEHYKCSVCDKLFADEDAQTPIAEGSEVIPALNHKNKITREASGGATCGNPGYIAHTYCPDCEKYFEDSSCTNEIAQDSVYNSIPHTPGELVSGVEPTCTQNGAVAHYRCGVCLKYFEDSECENEIENIVIPASHKLDKIEAAAPTCTAAGNIEHWLCSECSRLFSDAEGTAGLTTAVVAATGHAWGSAVNNISTCETCGITKTIVGTAEFIADNLEEGILANGETGTVKISVGVISPSKKLSKLLSDKGMAYFDRFVVDISIEKNDVKVTKTNEPVKIQIALPSDLKNKSNYHMFRVHEDVAEEITTNANSEGEKIVVDTGNVITLYATKFSEYAIVAENITLSDSFSESSGSSGGGGGGSSSLTVKFVTNVDDSVVSVRVKNGDKINESDIPSVTKAGYLFDGWYTDTTYTTKYDFKKSILKNVSIYAKWTKTEADEGTEITDDNGDKSEFTDVKEDDWFFEAVEYAKINGLMNGVTSDSFAPNDNVTRAMFVTVLYRVENEPAVSGSEFTDVEKDSWYSDAVAWASENGITSGVSASEFAPVSSISREQIATMLYRYARFKGYDVSAAERADLASYTDAAEISQYAVSAFGWAVEDDIISGKTETTLNPLDNATRAETAALLMRVIEKYSK